MQWRGNCPDYSLFIKDLDLHWWRLIHVQIQYWSLLNWRKMRFRCGFVAVPVNWNFVVISSYFALYKNVAHSLKPCETPSYLNIAKHIEITTKFQFTGTVTEPQRYRIFRQFNKDQYCTSMHRQSCTFRRCQWAVSIKLRPQFSLFHGILLLEGHITSIHFNYVPYTTYMLLTNVCFQKF